MTTLLVKAGERQRLLYLFSSSMSGHVRFSAVPVSGSGEVAGTVEVRGSNWLFPKAPKTLPLQRENAVEKGWFDTIYKIYITPQQDTQVTLHSRHFTARMLLWVLAAVLVVGLAAGLISTMGS